MFGGNSIEHISEGISESDSFVEDFDVEVTSSGMSIIGPRVVRTG